MKCAEEVLMKCEESSSNASQSVLQLPKLQTVNTHPCLTDANCNSHEKKKKKLLFCHRYIQYSEIPFFVYSSLASWGQSKGSAMIQQG